MTLFQELLLYGCIALAAFFLMEWAFYFFGGEGAQGEQRIRRRLGMAGAVAGETARASIKRAIEDVDPNDLSVDKYFKGLLLNSDSELTLPRLYIFIATLTIVLILCIWILVPVIPFLLNVLASLIVGFSLPIIALKRQAQARHEKFSEQFPDAIDLIVRSLRVGQPLSVAMQTVGRELSDPIGKEFDLVSQEIAYGKDVPDALESMMERVTLQDLRFFVVAVQIQHESGGNLAEILENLSKIIRGRFRLKRKVKALTAEGRFSAWFLSFFPVVMIFVMGVVSPGYYQKVMDFEYFNHAVVLIAFMLIVNVVAMRIITTVKV